MDKNPLITPFFFNAAVEIKALSKEKGRPIYKDVEMVQIRIAGDRHYSPKFPAKSMWRREDGVEHTYADRWPEQYARFQADQEQVVDGTPLSELPFLTEAKRAELRGLRVYTAEALAAIEGKNLKNLGMEANSLKQQAKAYIDKAGNFADTAKMIDEINSLKQQIEEMKADAVHQPVEPAKPDVPSNTFDGWSPDQLKEYIAEKTGSKPRGNPSPETLLSMAMELEESVAA
jgi:hypothetical protein